MKIIPHTLSGRAKRHRRVRAKAIGTSARPRLNVFRSINHIYAQVIDDSTGHTLAAAGTLDKNLRDQDGTKVADAKAVGQLVAERAIAAGVKQVVFDRGGYQYHGRVKALAEAAREAGLDF
ncbi:MAG TPA: 50S ribosomal protein L18 [Chloroflexia bacterium]|nr:50S ribosomal protein L18 [Chloroflexia bacterium]